MKRMSIVGLCLFAALAFSAITVASASATAPEFGRCLSGGAGTKYSDAGCTKAKANGKFGWTNVIVKKKFSASSSALATLETVGKTKITCTAEKNTNAEITGEKTVGKIVAEFSGCESSKIKCNSTGKGVGEITTFGLKGELGRETATKLEVQLTSEGSELAAFECGPLKVHVTGCVAHNVTADKMLSSATEKFSATKGEQKPDKFLGGGTDACALSTEAGKGPEESGQTFTGTVVDEELIEANHAV